MYQPTGGERIVKQQLKSPFILVIFNFILPQFQIKRALFSWVFPTYAFFCTKIIVLSCAFPAADFLDDLKKSSHMIISNLSAVFQSRQQSIDINNRHQLQYPPKKVSIF